MSRQKKTNCGGFGYIEILVATAILAISLMPAIEALYASSRLSQENNRLVDGQFHLRSKLDTVLAENFSALDTEALALNSHTAVSTVYSDSLGDAGRRLVRLSHYDMDNIDNDNDPFTGKDDSMLWISVELEDIGTLEALVSNL